MISKELLRAYGAVEIMVEKKEIIFNQGEMPTCYYQLISGEVSMYSLNEEGKEFTQGRFKPGSIFGEAPIFISKKYPASAIADTKCSLLKLEKEKFKLLLHENIEAFEKVIIKLSEKQYYKAIMITEISMENPEHRIVTLFNYMKTSTNPIEIKLTRQQVANMTALRVETVIRAIKSLERKGVLEIKKGRVYF